MLNLSCFLCEQGRHSYSLLLAWYPFRSNPSLWLVSSPVLGFHSTNTTPTAHLVLLACSIAKSFTKGSRALAGPFGCRTPMHTEPFARVQTYHSIANGSFCLDFLLCSQPPALLSGGSRRLALLKFWFEIILIFN